LKKQLILLLLVPALLWGCDNGSDSDSNPDDENPAESGLLGTAGPGGGTIFYDDQEGFDFDGSGTIESTEKNLFPGTSLDGMRYLEAAPIDWDGSDTSDTSCAWDGNPDSDTDQVTGAVHIDDLEDFDTYITTMGYGKSDTQAIVTHMENDTVTGTAAQLCAAYSGGGLNDWFLPSYAELRILVGRKSYVDDLLGFYPGPYLYWSSTQGTGESASTWMIIACMNSATDEYATELKDNSINGAHTRPIRAFASNP